MKTISTVLLAVLLAACAAAPESESRATNRSFEQIAGEWRGANINDMIRVWGDPRQLEQDESQGGAGSATWAIFGSDSDRRARCEAVAHFDERGLIHDVDVVSVNCPPDRPPTYRANWDICQLQRPSPASAAASDCRP